MGQGPYWENLFVKTLPRKLIAEIPGTKLVWKSCLLADNTSLQTLSTATIKLVYPQ